MKVSKVSKFFENMEQLLKKGNAKKLVRKANDRGLWYLPHHGFRHPPKSGKVRIGFECSANFGGACLNNKCLPGLDLTCQLPRVLL